MFKVFYLLPIQEMKKLSSIIYLLPYLIIVHNFCSPFVFLSTPGYPLLIFFFPYVVYSLYYICCFSSSTLYICYVL